MEGNSRGFQYFYDTTFSAPFQPRRARRLITWCGLNPINRISFNLSLNLEFFSDVIGKCFGRATVSFRRGQWICQKALLIWFGLFLTSFYCFIGPYFFRGGGKSCFCCSYSCARPFLSGSFRARSTKTVDIDGVEENPSERRKGIFFARRPGEKVAGAERSDLRLSLRRPLSVEAAVKDTAAQCVDLSIAAANEKQGTEEKPMRPKSRSGGRDGRGGAESDRSYSGDGAAVGAPVVYRSPWPPVLRRDVAVTVPTSP